MTCGENTCPNTVNGMVKDKLSTCPGLKVGSKSAVFLTWG